MPSPRTKGPHFNIWKCHISYVSGKLSRNTGVIPKLRHYLTLKHLTQISYNFISSYISYAIVAWGSPSKTNLQKVLAKYYHDIRIMYFATQSGKNTDSALPLLNILEILTVTNVHCLRVLKFVHAWHKGILPELFHEFFQYAANQNLPSKTNIGKQVSFTAIDLWQEIPCRFKNLNQFAFSKSAKKYVLSLQYQT